MEPFCRSDVEISVDAGVHSRARPLRFGEAFDQRLRQLVEDHVGIRETARLLHVDTRTVRLRAAKLGLETVWKPALCPSPVVVNPEGRRQEWCALMCDHRGAGRKDLVRLAPSLYAWLYRQDRDWLSGHLPATRRSTHPACSDWMNLDAQWVRRVAELAEDIRNASPPRKVTLAEISRRTEVPRWLLNHIRHLPSTQAYLHRVRDTSSSFQVRRVAWAARQLAASGKPLVGWHIRRMVGLEKRLTPEVEAALNNVLTPMAMTS